MKPASIFFKVIFLLPVLFIISCQSMPETRAVGSGSCHYVIEKGRINVLTINLLWSGKDRGKRLKKIAGFIVNNDVDVILLQEAVSGELVSVTTGERVKDENSGYDLRDILKELHGLDYNISTAYQLMANSQLNIANVTLSRCGIKYTRSQKLGFKDELQDDESKKIISFYRNVLIASLEVPGHGTINVYNTHLCAHNCTDKDDEGNITRNQREYQIKKLLKFVEKQDKKAGASLPSIIGGDFNFDRFDNDGEERPLWEMIINHEFIDKFIDAYADFAITNSSGQEALDTLCEDEDNADEHCTKGVTKFGDNGKNARRVDYIFTKSLAGVRDARVVFNDRVSPDQDSVSDHAGVFVSLELP